MLEQLAVAKLCVRGVVLTRLKTTLHTEKESTTMRKQASDVRCNRSDLDDDRQHPRAAGRAIGLSWPWAGSCMAFK